MPSYTQTEPRETYFVEPGKYEVEITKSVETTSKVKPDGTGGNPMIKLTCRVKLPDGTNGPELSDNLVFTAKALWKIDQVRLALGQAIVPGEEVTIEAEDLLGASAWVVLGEEPGSKNPDARFNTIERWVSEKELAEAKAILNTPSKAVKIHTDADGDDIPF
jgi:hypothetical protein